MARTVTVTLKAYVAQFRKAVGEAERATEDLGDAIDDVDGKGFDEAAAKAKGLGDTVGKTSKKAGRDLDDLAKHTRSLDAQIKRTEASIRQMAVAFAATGDPKIIAGMRAQQRELSNLVKVRKILPDPGELKDGITGSIRAALQTASPASLGVVALGAAIAPTLGAAIAAGVVGGAGIGGVVGGLALAARNPQVQAEAQALGLVLLAELEKRASGFVTPTIAGIRRIRTEMGTVGSDLDTIFTASRFIDPLVDGIIAGSKGLTAGLADAIEKADPVMEALASTISEVGTATGGLFTTLAEDADEGASAIYDLNSALVSLINTFGTVAHGFAQVKGGLDDFDVQLDKLRYAYEDWANENVDLYKGLDLTADGFNRNSKEALAYRDMVTGAGDAADVFTLRAAGMTDAQIRSIDATGKAVNAANEQAEQDRLRQAAAAGVTDALDGLAATEGRVKDAQEAATLAQMDLTAAMDAMNPAASRALKVVDGLKTAMDRLYGAQIRQVDANEAYEASWDGLSDSVKKNKGTLDIHTAAGRANRDALQDLLTSSRDMYLANIEAGMSTDEAAKKHRERTKAVEKEADRLGLNKRITGELIDTYGQIPPKKTTDLVVDGVNRVADRLFELSVMQYALEKGIPIQSARALLNGQNTRGPDKRNGGYASGGLFDGMLPGPPSDVDNLIGYGPNGGMFGLAGGEFVVNARQTAKNLPLLQAVNAGLDGYASGGYFPPTNTATRWPFPVTADRAYIMSEATARSKVAPEGPGGGATAPWIVSVIRANFPGIDILSVFRKGAKTLSGNTSYHARNRAVDTEPSEALARFFYTNYKGRLKELITPWQQYNVHNGKSHTYTGAVWNQHNFSGGNAHDHIAMAAGGVIGEPVFGVGRSGRTYSFGEVGPERVTPMRGYAGGGLVNVAPSTNTVGGGSRLDYLSSLLAARDAVASLTASLKENGRTWASNTAKGRDNRRALIAGVQAAQSAAEAKYAETGSVKAANAVYDDYIKRLDKSMKSMGVNAKTRKALLKAYSEKPNYGVSGPAPSNSSSRVRTVTDQMAAEEALLSARSAFAWTKPTFSAKTEAGRAELQQLFGFLGAAEAAAQSLYQETGNSKNATALYESYLAQLRLILGASGMAKAQIDSLLKQYGRITLTKNRWGGVYQAASGGLREAQIAAGGPTRYAWAEPETGGEAFIPRRGNRARSMAIWQHVGQNWLGQSMGGRSGPITIEATIPITLGADTITRQVRLEVDASIGRVVDAVVYQTA